MSVRELHWRLSDQDVVSRIEELKDQGVFHIFDKEVRFKLLSSSLIEVNGKRHRFYVVHQGGTSTVWLDGRTYRLTRTKKQDDAQPPTSHGTGEIRALMPGKLVQLSVGVGDTVAEKQTVAVMESMKMETPLITSQAGRVSEICFKPGDVVEMGEVVIRIDATVS